MSKYKDSLPYLLFAVAAVLELLLITSVANKLTFSAVSLGPWALEMSDSLSSIISWTVVVFVAVAFVLSWVSVKFKTMFVIILMTALVELLWGRVLPSPQDRWDLGLAFTAGAFLMFIAALREADFIQNAKDKLGSMWGSQPSS